MAPLDYLDYWLNSIHAHAAENTALIENGVTVGSAKRGTKSDCDTGEKEGVGEREIQKATVIQARMESIYYTIHRICVNYFTTIYFSINLSIYLMIECIFFGFFFSIFTISPPSIYVGRSLAI